MGWMSFPQSVNPKSAIDNPKMNLREIAAGAMICVSFAVCAKGNITGTVSNKGTGEPMDFVTVQIFDAASGTPLQISASTDENGHFTLKGVPDGNYVVKVINVGSVNQERNVGVKGSDIDLGNIRLADDAKLLKEVVVEGIRSQMRFELDRKVFQVDANIASAGQSASDCWSRSRRWRWTRTARCRYAEIPQSLYGSMERTPALLPTTARRFWSRFRERVLRKSR